VARRSDVVHVGLPHEIPLNDCFNDKYVFVRILLGRKEMAIEREDVIMTRVYDIKGPAKKM
jgi:hypothetical protein